MSGSGLIYAAVLGAWAVYFVSRSLRSGPREVVVPTEGVVLRRRGSVDVPAGSYAMLRPTSDVPQEPVVKQRRPDAAVAPGPPPARVSPATVLRRRRILFLLALICLATSATTITRVTPPWASALPVLTVATYLLEIRTQTRRAYAPQRVVPEPEIEVATRRATRRPKSRDAEFVDPWPAFEVAQAKPGRVADLVEGWEPRPVPLPTYVTAAKAEPVPGRRIDIGAGRSWTAAAEPSAVAESDTPAAATSVEPGTPERAVTVEAATTPDVEEPALEFEHKRAVND